MRHQKLFLIPALALGIATAGCGREGEERERAAGEANDVMVAPGSDVNADGAVGRQEGLVQPPDTGAAATGAAPAAPPPP